MKLYHLILLATLLLPLAQTADGQTRLKLSTIIPGTENVQLIYNGGFQSQGAVTTTNTHPYPAGWSRQADMFADPGSNMTAADDGVVALALVSGGASVCKYQCTVTLEPATDYILSAYLWNLGDAANHVTTVIDMNDAPGEAQVTLSYSDADADQGYFVYRGFNTTDTGTTITLRAFYDNLVGAGAASRYYPIGAQWDNLAITKASDFVVPAATGSDTNVRPLVSLTSPPDGTNILSPDAPVTLQLVASASDPDGSIARVEFYADATKLGEATASPYTLSWTIPASGSYQLTAVATDNQGATTVSAPVTVSATVQGPPTTPALRVFPSGDNIALYWPTSYTAFSLEYTASLFTPNWQPVTNVTFGGQQSIHRHIAEHRRAALFPARDDG